MSDKIEDIDIEELCERGSKLYNNKYIGKHVKELNDAAKHCEFTPLIYGVGDIHSDLNTISYQYVIDKKVDYEDYVKYKMDILKMIALTLNKHCECHLV